MVLLLLPMQQSIRSVSMEVTLLDSKHITLLPSKGCSSPNSLKILLFFHFRGVLFATSAFGLTSIASAPFFSGARAEHLRSPAFFTLLFHIHSLLSFFAHSLVVAGEASASTLPVPSIQAVSLFSFWRGSSPPQGPILDHVFLQKFLMSM
jgi:hypothetical protein